MTSILIAAAISGIVSGAERPADTSLIQDSTLHAEPMDGAKDGKHGCKGKNACKGQGGCKTDKHACKGQNACKGQGGCKG
jgi:hypothetical protein